MSLLTTASRGADTSQKHINTCTVDTCAPVPDWLLGVFIGAGVVLLLLMAYFAVKLFRSL